MFGVLRLIAVAIGESIGTAVISIMDRFFPKKTVGEQKADDRADYATEALKVNEAMLKAAESSPDSLKELNDTLTHGKL
jgi:hypothetical protein